ncbi:hypothetical protein T484DRAFT_1914107, partial [Baffinella frigidus]
SGRLEETGGGEGGAHATVDAYRDAHLRGTESVPRTQGGGSRRDPHLEEEQEEGEEGGYRGRKRCRGGSGRRRIRSARRCRRSYDRRNLGGSIPSPSRPRPPRTQSRCSTRKSTPSPPSSPLRGFRPRRHSASRSKLLFAAPRYSGEHVRVQTGRGWWKQLGG